jgi:hypothetical protein
MGSAEFAGSAIHAQQIAPETTRVNLEAKGIITFSEQK